MMKTAVIAGTYQQYVMWCEAQGLSKHDPRVVFVRGSCDLRGYRDLNVVCLGRARHTDSEQALRMRQSIRELLELITCTGGTVTYDQEPWKEVDAAH